MYRLEGRDFFDNIRRSVKISYFVASIIPLALLVYFSVKYVYPYVSGGDISNVPLSIGVLLVLAVAVSVLGLVLTTKATNSSIESAEELNTKINSLFDITKQFRETLHLDILLTKIMESAIELTSAESGSLLLYDEQGELECKVNTGAGAFTASRKVMNPGSTTGSLISAPLIYANETIGVIELRNRLQGIFTRHDEALLQSLADQAGISIAQNRANERQHSDFIHITEILVSAQDYVQNKKGHARRVANYANLTGKHLKFSDAELKKLYHACLLHDIGMLKLDTNDLLDKNKLAHHPRFGYDLVKSISLWSNSADIILHHHERYDGADKTDAQTEEDVPLSASIVSVADTFDVLTSEYEYGRQLDFRAAMEEIESDAGTRFDPSVVQAFKEAITEAGITGGG